MWVRCLVVLSGGQHEELKGFFSFFQPPPLRPPPPAPPPGWRLCGFCGTPPALGGFVVFVGPPLRPLAPPLAALGGEGGKAKASQRLFVGGDLTRKRTEWVLG